MEKKFSRVEVAVETWNIPSYPFPEAEEMPMFSETANHQGTTGNPYPARVVSARKHYCLTETPMASS